jgi:EAL domain-containing protein (putative c-di-GMP-specific phosphodiesterase class I)
MNDIFARIGGNEFSIIVRNATQAECSDLGDRLIATVSEPYHIMDQYRCNAGLNIGASHFPYDSKNAEDLMKYADLAAFTVKVQKNSGIKFYSSELRENLRKRNELEAALREAIKEQQFELYLQPVLDLNTNEIVKAEALIRWRRPSIGLVPPDEFIPIAEQTGLILPIGQWVIQQAVKLLAELHQQQRQIKLSVNLSPTQVSDANLLNFIHESVENCSIDASYLELELTEGVLVDDFDKIRYFLEEVRKLGISVAIDDFGTGYSSLSYLQKLPIDHLKIDRSFIRELTGSESNRAIVLAVIAMAKGLKLGVIAEGVENEEQQQFLLDNDCHAAQGYLFSRPVPFNEFRQLFK